MKINTRSRSQEKYGRNFFFIVGGWMSTSFNDTANLDQKSIGL